METHDHPIESESPLQEQPQEEPKAISEDEGSPVSTEKSRPVSSAISQDIQANAISADQEWTAIAAFMLEFKIRESNGDSAQRVSVRELKSSQEKTWTALDDDSVYPWILEQVKKALEGLPAETKSAVPQSVQITQVRFLQPMHIAAGVGVNATHALPERTLNSTEPVAVEVSFNLVGLAVHDLMKQALPYQIQGKFHNLMTGMDTPLNSGSLGHLIENQRSYTIRLPEVTLSPGVYQLQIFATLHHASIPLGTLQVPVLQVI